MKIIPGGIDPLTGTQSAGAHVASGCAQITKKWNLPCIVTEAGYPTVGDPHKTKDGTARTGVSRQSAFWADMEAVSRKEKVAVYAFEPFDGDWKRRFQAFVEMDYSFGMMTCDRKMKDIKLPPLGAL